MNNATQSVKDFLNAVQTGNQPKLAELIHPEVKWFQPGKNRFSGVKNSAGEVFAMIGGMYEVTKTHSFFRMSISLALTTMMLPAFFSLKQ